MQKEDAAAAAALNDPLEALLSQLGSGEGGEGDEALQTMLENMMKQLMSKDVLYEPLKELQDKVSPHMQSLFGRKTN